MKNLGKHCVTKQGGDRETLNSSKVTQENEKTRDLSEYMFSANVDVYEEGKKF